MSNQWLATRKRQDISTGRRDVNSNTAHNQDLVVADLSGSMESEAFEGKSRYQCLQEALKPFKGRIQVLAFNTRVWEVDADRLPYPDMYTNMAGALDTAKTLEPMHVLLVSDGIPDSVPKALESAKSLAEQCIIDTLYIGPENEKVAIDTMKEIARIGRGRFRDFRIDKSSPALLESKIDQLLALPNPGSIQL